MNTTNRRIVKYRVMGLVIIVFSLFAMAFSVLLLQEQQQLAIRAQIQMFDSR